MAISTIKISSGTGTGCVGHELPYGAGGVRRSFMKLAAATATLTGLAMTARMTVKVVADEGKSVCNDEPCR